MGAYLAPYPAQNGAASVTIRSQVTNPVWRLWILNWRDKRELELLRYLFGSWNPGWTPYRSWGGNGRRYYSPRLFRQYSVPVVLKRLLILEEMLAGALLSRIRRIYVLCKCLLRLLPRRCHIILDSYPSLIYPSWISLRQFGSWRQRVEALRNQNTESTKLQQPIRTSETVILRV